jgi:hypothetical protein
MQQHVCVNLIDVNNLQGAFKSMELYVEEIALKSDVARGASYSRCPLAL